MNVTGKITDLFPVVHCRTPRRGLSDLHHVAGQYVACIDQGVMRRRPACIHALSLTQICEEPIRPQTRVAYGEND